MCTCSENKVLVAYLYLYLKAEYLILLYVIDVVAGSRACLAGYSAVQAYI